MLQYNQTHCSVYRTSRQELHCIHIHHHGGECYSVITSVHFIVLLYPMLALSNYKLAQHTIKLKCYTTNMVRPTGAKLLTSHNTDLNVTSFFPPRRKLTTLMIRVQHLSPARMRRFFYFTSETANHRCGSLESLRSVVSGVMGSVTPVAWLT